jgi:hypothetical protein
MPCHGGGGGSGMLGAGYQVFTGKRKIYVHFNTILMFVYSLLIAHSFVIMTVSVEHYKISLVMQHTKKCCTGEHLSWSYGFQQYLEQS